MSFDPYLHFQGTCRAAMTFCQSAFGGRREGFCCAAAPDVRLEMAASNRIMQRP